MDMVKYSCVLLGHSIICCISRMNELSWVFACSCMVLGKWKVTLGMHMVIHGCDLLGPAILKSALSQLKNTPMNWAEFLQAGSEGIIFS